MLKKQTMSMTIQLHRLTRPQQHGLLWRRRQAEEYKENNMHESRFALFTDVSLNPQRKIGVGGYLLLPISFLEREAHDIEQGEVSSRLIIRRFAESSSTKLELQTVLWALENSREELSGSVPASLRIYTDSQCVAGLLGRRAGLTKSDFLSGRSGRPLTNAHLYRAFYEVFDQLGFQLVKVSGHSRASSHDTVQRIFSYVDREVRKALILWLNYEGSNVTSKTFL
jgi:ribonuclease HI